MPEIPDLFTQQHWDERYGSTDRVWSGRPNAQLVAFTGELTPGTALDVACGEGGDAIWLAGRGWTVTGVDISPVGLARAAEHARQAGDEIAARITWRQADLFADRAPELGTFSLVTSHYLHLPPVVRERAMARLAGAVAPGGHLLVVAHHPRDLEVPGLRPNLPELFQTAEQLGEQLDPETWEILAAQAPAREVEHRRTGETVTVHDAVLLARRRS
ncbi:MAG TPA: class I SAM-dependent methyltransferase [Solirubrobacteraceae bacterium]|nr:class I SAM-dependent methyltransferase [Solirubrobacteraceae bacterium]